MEEEAHLAQDASRLIFLKVDSSFQKEISKSLAEAHPYENLFFYLVKGE